MPRGHFWGPPSDRGLASRSLDEAARTSLIGAVGDRRKLPWATAPAGCLAAAVASRQTVTTLSRARETARLPQRPRLVRRRRRRRGRRHGGRGRHSCRGRGTLGLSSYSFLRPLATAVRRRSPGGHDSHGDPCFSAAWGPPRRSSTAPGLRPSWPPQGHAMIHGEVPSLPLPHVFVPLPSPPPPPPAPPHALRTPFHAPLTPPASTWNLDPLLTVGATANDVDSASAAALAGFSSGGAPDPISFPLTTAAAGSTSRSCSPPAGAGVPGRSTAAPVAPEVVAGAGAGSCAAMATAAATSLLSNLWARLLRSGFLLRRPSRLALLRLSLSQALVGLPLPTAIPLRPQTPQWCL